jgi:hypothetical protein
VAVPPSGSEPARQRHPACVDAEPRGHDEERV